MWKFPGFLVLTFNSQKAHDIVEVFNGNLVFIQCKQVYNKE